jgi:putative RNA 2'-phosphotransferase
LGEADLIAMIEQSSKKRHELKNGKIRALYGHSIPQKLLKEPAKPPARLYHGTASERVATIAKEGLKPMRRHYVHLSSDRETAQQVGKRKSSKSEILIIKANEAHQNGIIFYSGNDQVWLADYVPPEYIELLSS